MAVRSPLSAAVAVMLNLNKPLDDLAADAWSSDWKVLVFDQACREIVAPLFDTEEKRRQGVTLSLLLGGGCVSQLVVYPFTGCAAGLRVPCASLTVVLFDS